MLSTAHKLNVITIITIIKFKTLYLLSSVQSLSHVQLFAESMPGFPAHHPLLELAQLYFWAFSNH